MTIFLASIASITLAGTALAYSFVRSNQHAIIDFQYFTNFIDVNTLSHPLSQQITLREENSSRGAYVSPAFKVLTTLTDVFSLLARRPCNDAREELGLGRLCNDSEGKIGASGDTTLEAKMVQIGSDPLSENA